MAQLPASPNVPSPPAGWFRRRVMAPLSGLLRQGLAPEQLALTVALGVSIGLVPLLGATTALAAFVALRLRLNVAALQVVAHLAGPVQLLLLLPLLRQGARLFGHGTTPDLTLAALRQLLAHDWRGALRLLWRAELGALALWLPGGLVLSAGLYFVLKPVFRRLVARSTATATF